jgi:hypothetical protein
MCIPLDTSGDAKVWGREGFDPFQRLRVVADAYGLPPGREELVRLIEESMEQGSAFVRGRVERGEPAFIKMWNEMGGQGRYDRRREWFAVNRPDFLAALG